MQAGQTKVFKDCALDKFEAAVRANAVKAVNAVLPGLPPFPEGPVDPFCPFPFPPFFWLQFLCHRDPHDGHGTREHHFSFVHPGGGVSL